jgi:hypothetical protein
MKRTFSARSVVGLDERLIVSALTREHLSESIGLMLGENDSNVLPSARYNA